MPRASAFLPASSATSACWTPEQAAEFAALRDFREAHPPDEERAALEAVVAVLESGVPARAASTGTKVGW